MADALKAYNSKAPFIRLTSAVQIEDLSFGGFFGDNPNRGTVYETLQGLGFDPLYFSGNQLAKSCQLFGGVPYYKPEDRDESGEIIEGTSEERLNFGLSDNNTPLRSSPYAVGTTGPQMALTNGAYGWGNTSTYNRGFVPMPGITDVQVQYYNNGALSEATVNIKCYSKSQFAIIDALYLRPGYTVLLEFGHSVYVNNFGDTRYQQEYEGLAGYAAQ